MNQKKKKKQNNIFEIFSFLVTKRIVDPNSILSAFNEVDEYSFNISTSKNSFYRILDIVYENRDNLLVAINNMINLKSNRKLDQIFLILRQFILKLLRESAENDRK